MRKHRLAERLLTDIIGLDWHKAHTRGRPVGARDLRRGRGATGRSCSSTRPPARTATPSRGRASRAFDLHALSESTPGDRVRLERVTEQVERDADSLVYLSEHGFVPGVDAEVQAKAPDGTLTLQLHDGTIALGPRARRPALRRL